MTGSSMSKALHSSVMANDNERAEIAQPQMLQSAAHSTACCHKHLSWLYLIPALLLLFSHSATAQPWDDHHHHPHRSDFGPHLHGPETLPNGAQWPLFQEHWRVVGPHLTTPNFTVALEEASRDIYSQYSFHGMYAGSRVSQPAPVTLDGRPVPSEELVQDPFSAEVLSVYDSLEVSLDVAIDNRAWFPDLGFETQTNHERLINLMQSDGFDTTAWLTSGYKLMPKGAKILHHMPIPCYKSHVLHLEVTGANLVPFTLQKQNLVLSVLQDLLAVASVFAIRLDRVEQQSGFPETDVSSASLFIVVQQDDRGLFIAEAVDRATMDPMGTPLFDARMANAGLPASARLKHFAPFFGDSITDQIDHDPGRPPWTRPWEVAVLTLGAVGLALISCLGLYLCNKRCLKPLLLQRAWAGKSSRAHDLDIELARNDGLGSLGKPGLDKLSPQHMSRLNRLRALLQPSSVLYSPLADDPASLDHPRSSCADPQDDSGSADLEGGLGLPTLPDALNMIPLQGRGTAPLPPVQLSQPAPSDQLRALSVREDVTLSASWEMACGRPASEAVMHAFEPGMARVVVEQPLGGARGSFGIPGRAVQGWAVDPNQISICQHPVKGGDWQLGSGSYGVVYKARRGLQDVAVKTLHPHLMDPNTTPTQAHDSICRELRILKHALTNPQQVIRQEAEMLQGLSYDTNVVQFYGSCVKDGKILLVLEYMEGGDLKHALKGLGNRPKQLHWYRQGSSIALDILKGIHFLHMHGVLHRDIKTANVLLSKGYDKAKICDVGLAHIMGTTGATSTPTHHVQATFAYCSPEMLFNQRCNEAADIYSYGVVLWEIITQTTPVRGNLRDIEVPAECPQEVADLVDRCLEEAPTNRPSAQEIFDVITRSQLQHPEPPVVASDESD